MSITTVFDAVADRTLAVIRDKGQEVRLRRPLVAEARNAVYNPASDTWGDVGVGADDSGLTVTRGVVIATLPLALLIDAAALTFAPETGTRVTWVHLEYRVRIADRIAPLGNTILWHLVLEPTG